MSNLLNVEIDHDLIYEFLEELELSFQLVETHIIALEKGEFVEDRMKTIKHVFENLSLNSAKLYLVPLSEILDYAILVFERFIQWQFFSPASAELVLLYMDRILHITKEVERDLVIDLTETQNVLVSFQQIASIQQADEFEVAIINALKVITKNISTNTAQSDVDDLFDLFSSDNVPEVSSNSTETEATTSSNKKEDEDINTVNVEGIDILVPKTLDEALLHAKEIIMTLRQDTSIALLSDISEINNPDGNYHNPFVLEIGLAINYIAGKPIDPEGLAKGICLRDIGLVNSSVDILKPEKLSQEEFILLKQHPILAAKLAEDLAIHEDGINAIIHHHERMDGTGYPYNLKNDEISEAGKLTAIIDSFNAMIDVRPHKRFSRSALRAIAEINACIDTHYDKFWIKQFNLFMRHHWLPIQISQYIETDKAAINPFEIIQSVSLKVS